MKTTEIVKALVTLGVTSFLVLFLLGAIPGLRSPIDRLVTSLEAHDKKTDGVQRTLRVICRGIWRGNAIMESECDR